MHATVSLLRAPLLRRLGWWRPEWPWAIAAATAWVLLFAGAMLPRAAPATHAGHAHLRHHAAPELSGTTLGWWTLMVVAMMLPGTLPAIRAVSLASMWHRRYRAAAAFAVTYVGTWIVVGAGALGVWAAVGGPGSGADAVVTAAVLLSGAGWQLTRWHRRSLKACHRRLPVGTRGAAADRACVRYGRYHAAACVAACWPTMLAMVPAHAPTLMVSLGALTTWQRRARRPRRCACAAALGALAAMTALAGA